MQYTLYAVKDNAEAQLDSNIGASTLSIILNAGQGALFPQPYSGTTTSGGSSTTLNKTGIGASGIAVGDYIENTTDGSHAYVTVVSTDSLTTTELQGGSDNTWQNADGYLVNPFIGTLNKRDVDGIITASEKVKIIGRSTDSLTVDPAGRGFDGSTAQSFSADDYFNIFVVAKSHAEVRKALADVSQQMDLKASITYVQSAMNARTWKNPVVVATTGAGTLATSFENGDTIDGVVLATGDRILIKDQAAPAENGIYTVNASGEPTRATDFDSTAEVTGAAVTVIKGTSNADTAWICTADSPTIGSSSITFAQVGASISKASQAEAQAGTDDTKFMTPLRVVDSTDARPYYRRNYTFGEAIDGTTTPQACYLKASDGKVYKADANLSLEAEYQFIGFTKENISIDNTGNVIVGGVVTGFSALTINQNYYLSDTAGAISSTPSTTAAYKVCRALTATEVLIEKGPKIIIGTVTCSNPASPGATADTTISVPFRAKRINLKGYLTICDLAGGVCVTRVFDHEWNETTSIGGIYMKGAGNGSFSTLSGAGRDSSSPVDQPASGANRSSLTVSVQSVTNTTCVIRVTNTTTAGSGATNGQSVPITYVIEG